MAVLSDVDIEQALERNDLGIEPFIQKNLTPNGYDLSIDEVYLRTTDEHIKEGVAIIPPLTWFAISTKEFVKMGPLSCGFVPVMPEKGSWQASARSMPGFMGRLPLDVLMPVINKWRSRLVIGSVRLSLNIWNKHRKHCIMNGPGRIRTSVV